MDLTAMESVRTVIFEYASRVQDEMKTLYEKLMFLELMQTDIETDPEDDHHSRWTLAILNTSRLMITSSRHSGKVQEKG